MSLLRHSRLEMDFDWYMGDCWRFWGSRIVKFAKLKSKIFSLSSWAWNSTKQRMDSIWHLLPFLGFGSVILVKWNSFNIDLNREIINW